MDRKLTLAAIASDESLDAGDPAAIRDQVEVAYRSGSALAQAPAEPSGSSMSASRSSRFTLRKPFLPATL
jgi:hypothetical protein